MFKQIYFVVILAFIATVFISFYSGKHAGFKQCKKDWDLQVAEQKLEIEKLKLQSEEITSKTITKYIDRIKIVEKNGENIVKEVPVYITKADNDNCVLSNSVRLLHDAAVLNKNTVSESTGIVDDRTAPTENNGKK